MIKKFLFALAVLATLNIVSQAQNIGDYRGRLSEKATFEPTKISVEDTKYIGITYIDASDSILMKNCGIILRRDLDFSPFFEIVLFDEFFMRHLELKAMTISAWKWLGAEYLVKLEAEFPRDNIRLRYRLLTTDTKREIKKGTLESTKRDYRTMVHDMANEIVKFLTGDDGIFRTKIVYVKQIDSTKEIFMADYDGQNEYQLTNNKSINISPALTPDGRYVLFTSYKDGDPKIYVLDLKDNSVDLIAGYPGLNAAPAVSPDGKTVACVLSRDGNSEIYLLDRKGNIKKRLTKSWAIESAPTWSPDGKEIAFSSDRTGSPQIYIMNREGLDVRRLTFTGSYNDSPCWSPKGDRLVYVSRAGGFTICSVDVTGKNHRILANLGNNENPHFSPDGNHVIFSSTRLGPKEIYTMDLFGNNQRRLTVRGGFSNPAWSPLIK
jgi:TolB protein